MYPVYVHPAFTLGDSLMASDDAELLEMIRKGMEMSPVREVFVRAKKVVFTERRPVRKIAG